MSFTDHQLERYSRNIIVNEIGGKGQEALLAAKVLVIGAGGLGSPVLYYLAASGVGSLGIIDNDFVELSNLQRQIIHRMDGLGRAKTESAKAALAQLNPDCQVTCYTERLTAENAAALIGSYDIIADGSDNFETRFLVSDTCYAFKKPLVSAAIRGFQGQLYTFTPYLDGDYPCYRCLYADVPPEGSIASCTQGGVMGSVAGVMGSLQATEVIKEITGAGEGLAGTMLIYDGLKTSFRKVRLHRDGECRLCR